MKKHSILLLGLVLTLKMAPSYAAISSTFTTEVEDVDTTELNDAMEDSPNGEEPDFIVERGDLTEKQFAKRVEKFCNRIKKDCKDDKDTSRKECKELKDNCMAANGVESKFTRIKESIVGVVKKGLPKLKSMFSKGSDEQGEFIEATIDNNLISKLESFKQMIGKKSYVEKKDGNQLVLRTYLKDEQTLKQLTLPNNRPFPKFIKIDGVRERFAGVNGWMVKNHYVFFDTKRKVVGFFIENDMTDLIFQEIDAVVKQVGGPIVGAIVKSPDYLPFPVKVNKEPIGRISLMSKHKDQSGTAGLMVLVDYTKLYAQIDKK